MSKIDYCVVCNRPTTTTHHLVFGRGRRAMCENERPKLVIPLCDNCHTLGRYRLHDNPTSEYLSKAFGQALWEKRQCANGCTEEEAREKFIAKYGKNWIVEGE